MVKNLSDFKYLTFDVVGTLIDFEGGLKASLTEIGQSAGGEVTGRRRSRFTGRRATRTMPASSQMIWCEPILRLRRSLGCQRSVPMARSSATTPATGRPFPTVPWRLLTSANATGSSP